MKAVSSLGFLEERLRRLLGLTGEIGTTFSPGIIPVVIADDARAAGYNPGRGRRWAGYFGWNFTAINQSFGFTFPSGGIIEGWDIFNVTAGAQCAAFYCTPDVTVPITIGTSDMPYRELNANNNERAPVVRSLGFIAAGGVVGRGIWANQWQANQSTQHNFEIHMTAGSSLLFTSTAGASGAGLLSIRGRTV